MNILILDLAFVHYLSRDEVDTPSFVSATGDTIAVSGQIEASCVTGSKVYQHNFVVIQNWSVAADVILGLDFLKNIKSPFLLIRPNFLWVQKKFQLLL